MSKTWEGNSGLALCGDEKLMSNGKNTRDHLPADCHVPWRSPIFCVLCFLGQGFAPLPQ